MATEWDRIASLATISAVAAAGAGAAVVIVTTKLNIYSEMDGGKKFMSISLSRSLASLHE